MIAVWWTAGQIVSKLCDNSLRDFIFFPMNRNQTLLFIDNLEEFSLLLQSCHYAPCRPLTELLLTLKKFQAFFLTTFDIFSSLIKRKTTSLKVKASSAVPQSDISRFIISWDVISRPSWCLSKMTVVCQHK